MKWLDKLKGKESEPFVPATESQGNYVIMMYRDLDDWTIVANKPTDYTIAAFWKMDKLVKPYINTDDYYDRSVWTLSKSKASEIITTMKPIYERVRDEET